jgi:hypothetical protein
MKEKFLQLLREMERADIAKDPRFITMRELHLALQSEGFTGEEASRIVSRIKIDVDESLVKDKEFLATATRSYCKMISNLKANLDLIEPTLFWESVKSNDDFSFKYNV